jgi:hypothetical protein
MAKKSNPSAAGKILRVHSKRPSFRRAGIQFGVEPVDLAMDELEDERIAAIKAEPMLVAVEVDAAPAQ